MAGTDMTDCGGREDPRVARSRACVLAAAAAVLEAEGAAKVTFEGVASRAGVAKTTIYRLWPCRNELLIAAYDQLAWREPVSPTPDLRHDVVDFVQRLNRALRDEPRSRALPGLVDLAERDPALADLCERFAERRRAALVGRLVQARADGDLADDVEAELLAAELVGPVFYRRYFTRRPFTDAEVALHVGRLLDSVSARPTACSGSDAPLRSPR